MTVDISRFRIFFLKNRCQFEIKKYFGFCEHKILGIFKFTYTSFWTRKSRDVYLLLFRIFTFGWIIYTNTSFILSIQRKGLVITHI